MSSADMLVVRGRDTKKILLELQARGGRGIRYDICAFVGLDRHTYRLAERRLVMRGGLERSVNEVWLTKKGAQWCIRERNRVAKQSYKSHPERVRSAVARQVAGRPVNSVFDLARIFQ